MRTRTMPLAAVALALASPSTSGAQTQVTQVGGPDVQVEVGKSVVVSPGPIYRLICDDPIVEAVPTDAGMTFKGLRPGQTTCSFTNPVPVRVILSVEVVPAPKGAAGPTGR